MAADSWHSVSFLVSVLLAGLVGYAAGQFTSASAGKPPAREQTSKKNSISDDDSEEEARADGDIASVQTSGPCKMVFVVRTDLGMTKGKIAAQCGHATLACYKALQTSNPRLLRHWEYSGQAKIALQTDSEENILLLQATAQSLNLVARVIQDAGRTQIEAGSRTVLGIGPGPVALINEVTGHLKLL